MSTLARAKSLLAFARLNPSAVRVGASGFSADDLAELVALAEAADAWSRTTLGTEAETDAARSLLWHTAKVTGALDEAAAEVVGK